MEINDPSNVLKKKFKYISSLTPTPCLEAKFQLTCFDINGKLFKQGIYSTRKRAYSAQKKASEDYGAYLRFEVKEVPASQKKPAYVANVDNQYCFCAETPIWANKCDKCGKNPYTD